MLKTSERTRVQLIIVYISVGFLKLKILLLHEYIHILYHWIAEALQIPVVLETSHLMKNSLNYGHVKTIDSLKTMQLLHFR